MQKQSLILGLALCAVSAGAAPKFSQSQIDFFERRIRPVLARQCFECHSPRFKVKGGLSLESRQAMIDGGESGAAILPGKPEQSLLFRTVARTERDLEMPPKEADALTEEQVNDFRKWIAMGAPDPRKSDGKTAGALSVDWQKAQQHWAFRPITKPSVPSVKDSNQWAQNEIDHFVLAKLEANGMQPNPQANRRVLLRRASYALTGLPPETRDAEDFVNDPNPKAFPKLVDRYLASDHYGERMARYWMDVARYADTTGDRSVRRQPRYQYAWTYRDYLIDTFNRDLPFDRFITEQIAADHLQGDDDRKLAALGFLTIGKRFMGQTQEVIDDRIDVVTQGFMALTVSCARCHDHKFDPVPTEDYYSLHGIFSSTTEPSPGPIIGQPNDPKAKTDFEAEVAKLEADLEQVRITEQEKVLTKFRTEVGKYLFAVADFQRTVKKVNSGTIRQYARDHALDPDLFPQWMEYLKAAKTSPIFRPWFAAVRGVKVAGNVHPRIAKIPTAKRDLKQLADAYGAMFTDVQKQWKAELKKNPKTTRLAGADESLRQVIYGKNTPIQLDRKGFQRLVGVRIRNAENRVRGKIAELEGVHPGAPIRAMAVEDIAKPRDSYVAIRGEPRNRGDRVPRQFLKILSDADRQPFDAKTSGRLDLAKSIATRDNPLTARVIVNRVWQWHFGQGIVRTPGDFGMRADTPTHPELLDWLATWFMDNGWSLKQLHQKIVASATWQQGSQRNTRYEEKDPANELLWRRDIRRLDLESLRDTLIVLGGRADLSIGGRSLDLEDEGRHRRTLYGEVDRSAISELYRIFDFANPDMSQARRLPTTVPQQALFMMNSGFANDEARALANRDELRSSGTDEEKVNTLYQLAYQREPGSRERELALRYLAPQRSRRLDNPPHMAWEFGYQRAGRAGTFQALPSMSTSSAYLRDRKATAAEIKAKTKRSYALSVTSRGGTFANHTRYAIVQRWISPADGSINLTGKLSHYTKDGQGLVAILRSDQRGQLGQWKLAQRGSIATDLSSIPVRMGEKLDFIVQQTKPSALSSFQWAPKISLGEKTWDWTRDFSAALRQARAGARPLNEWERLAQVVLLGNELIYLN